MKTLSYISVVFLFFCFILTSFIQFQTSQHDKDTAIEMVIQDNHGEKISSVDYNPDGSLIVTQSIDGIIKLWNDKGLLIRTFKGEGGLRSASVFSPDAKSIISVGDNSNNMSFFDLSGNLIKTVKIPVDEFESPNSVTGIKVSHSENLIFTSVSQHKIIVWSNDGTRVRTINGGFSYCISPDGKSILVSETDNQIKWMNFEGEVLKSIPEKECLGNLSISPDNKTIFASALEKSKLWDITGRVIKNIPQKTYEGKNFVDFAVISPDGKYIALVAHYFTYSNTTNRYIDILMIDGKRLRTIETDSEEWIDGVTFSPDSKTIATIARNQLYGGILRFWDVNGNLVNVIKKEKNEISSLNFSSDGKTLTYSVSTGFYSSFKIWSLEGKLIQTSHNYSEAPNGFAFSSDNKIFAAEYGSYKNENYSIIVTGIEGKLNKSLKGHKDLVPLLCFSNDSKTLVSGSWDKTIKIWNIETSKCLKTIICESNPLTIALSNNGKQIAVGLADGNFFRLFSIEGELLKTFPINKRVYGCMFSPDNQMIMTCSGDDSLKIWNTNGNLLKTYQGNAISSDFKTLAKVTNAEIQLINLETNITKIFKRIIDPRYSFLFNPNGKLLINVTRNGSIEIMNTETGKITIFYTNAREWIVYTPDGYFDASQSGGNIIAMVKGQMPFAIDQFAIKFNRPDIILKNLGSADQGLMDHYFNQYRKRLKRSGLNEEQLSFDFNIPTVILTDVKQDGKFVTLYFTITSETFDLRQYNIYINDVPVFGANGKTITSKSQTLTERIELTKGYNKIEISCTNEQGYESFRALTSATFNGEVKSDLYLLAFGVSKYSNPALNLQYADKDANDLSKVFEKIKKKGFVNYYYKVLTNEQVTPDAIKAAKDFVKNAKVDDTFVLFIAGHGIHDTDPEATYYFLTSNADLKNLKGTAADFETIEDLLQGIPPRNKLFLMDACESGEIDEEEQGQMIASASGVGINSRGFKVLQATTSTSSVAGASPKRTYLFQKDRYIYNDLVRRSGAIIFSSCKGGELSYERSDIENGLFTEYIMKALTTSEADKDNNGFISTDELRQYVSEQVAKASGDLQHPTVDRDNIYQKFGFQIK